MKQRLQNLFIQNTIKEFCKPITPTFIYDDNINAGYNLFNAIDIYNNKKFNYRYVLTVQQFLIDNCKINLFDIDITVGNYTFICGRPCHYFKFRNEPELPDDLKTLDDNYFDTDEWFKKALDYDLRFT